MAIDYKHLLNIDIPEVRQRLTRRDTAFYALSVGLGQDPLNESQLRYVDESHRDLAAVPSMPVVLGHPGFWLGDRNTGVDAVRVVHGEQAFQIHRPLPTEGEFVAKTRVSGIVDKGPGKGALLYSEKEVRDTTTGELLATTNSTTFLRGDGGFGGPSGPVKPARPVPTRNSDVQVDLATRLEQAFYYRMNGDDNPLHLDPKVAAEAGFPRPILHGLCTLGVVTHALLAVLAGYDPARIRSLELRFSAPIFPGETIRTEIWNTGEFRSRVVERDALVINNGFVMLD